MQAAYVMSTYLNSLTPFTRAIDTSWQCQLRRSVRLYLAMGDQSINAQELETHLRQTEEELVSYLLAGELPTDDACQQARGIVDMAQSQLLGQEREIKLLLRELSAEQALRLPSPAWPELAHAC